MLYRMSLLLQPLNRGYSLDIYYSILMLYKLLLEYKHSSLQDYKLVLDICYNSSYIFAPERLLFELP